MPDTNPLALVADIGGTNARFGLIEPETFIIRHRHVAFTRQEPTLDDALGRWLASLDAHPTRGALAVAGPVTEDRFVFTNSPWSFSRSGLAGRFGLDPLTVLNDFEALALSLPHLKDDALLQIGGSAPEPGTTKAVVGAGTGLGVGALAPVGTGWTAVPSEGGHITFSPETDRDFAILKAMRRECGGRVSAERLLSGPGLTALYGVLAQLEGGTPPPIDGEEITRRALERSDPVAVEAMDLFTTWLGRFAGDMALTFAARGGVYLGGGIAPRIASLLVDSRFREAFDDKGRLSRFVVDIPVYVIMTPDAPLIGAATILTRSPSA